MANRTISLPDDVTPIIESLDVPFSTWVADQLRRHAAAQGALSANSCWPTQRWQGPTHRRGIAGGDGTNGAVGAVVARGGVYWIELDKRRPCIVVSSVDVLAVDVWQTHVVPLTSRVGRAGIAGNVLLPAVATGLPKDSVAVPLGLELIDRSLLARMRADTSVCSTTSTTSAHPAL
jgi:mRNA interferase MazF